MMTWLTYLMALGCLVGILTALCLAGCALLYCMAGVMRWWASADRPSADEVDKGQLPAPRNIRLDRTA